MLEISVRGRASWLLCACVLLLGCASAVDLDALGIPLPDGGLPGAANNHGDGGPGAPGDGDVSATGTGSPGDGAGSGANTGNLNGGGGSGGSGSAGPAGSGGGFPFPGANAGSSGGGFPFPGANAGSSGGGFPFPGANAGSSGGGFPGGGGNQNTPPTEDVSACSPCDSAMGAAGTVPACCTDGGACGVDLGALTGNGSDCVMQNAPGAESAECPAVDYNGTAVPGCCMPSGQCGILIRRIAPLGCVEPDVVADVLPGLTGGGGGSCTP